jgi:2-methylisocitrate lyase-like PEP mutase family enzyme
MRETTQSTKARRFLEMHSRPGIVVLPNAWDAASARVFDSVGFEAIGTTSAGIAYSMGRPDGEKISPAAMLAAIREIVASTSLPVTADIETGYSDSPEEIRAFTKAVIAAGAVGVNIEDGTGDRGRPLADIDLQVAKIAAIRAAADEMHIPLVINARTDVYWLGIDHGQKQLDHAIRRANMYRRASADCLFVPGAKDAKIIAALVKGIDGPLNILGGPGVPPIPELEKLGVSRVSVGSGPARAILTRIRQIGEELRGRGTYTFANNVISYSDANKLFDT